MVSPFRNLPQDLQYQLTLSKDKYVLKCFAIDAGGALTFSVKFENDDYMSLIIEAEDFFDDKPGKDTVVNGEVAGAEGSLYNGGSGHI